MAVEHNILPETLSLAVHELRTPVTVVAGYLRMLLREQAGPISEKQRKMLEEADRSCGRLGALVAEMSEFGKLEGGEVAFARQDFDLSALIVELASGLHDAEDRGVQFEARAATPVGMKEIMGDRRSRADRRGCEGIDAIGVARAHRAGSDGRPMLRRTGNPRWGVVAIGDEAVLPDSGARRCLPTAGVRRMAGRPRTRAARRPTRHRSSRRRGVVRNGTAGARNISTSATVDAVTKEIDPMTTVVDAAAAAPPSPTTDERRPSIAVVDDDSGFAGYLRTFLDIRGYRPARTRAATRSWPRFVRVSLRTSCCSTWRCRAWTASRR